jgi:hypothetical protein
MHYFRSEDALTKFYNLNPFISLKGAVFGGAYRLWYYGINNGLSNLC